VAFASEIATHSGLAYGTFLSALVMVAKFRLHRDSVS
jgi:hypothetical protein